MMMTISKVILRMRISLKDDTASWVNQHRIPRCTVNDLLKLLKKNGYAELPSTSRTLLKTTKSREVTVKSNMQYTHITLIMQMLMS